MEDVFPQPVDPTNAIFCPGDMVNDNLFNTFFFSSVGNVKSTFSNWILPTNCLGLRRFSSYFSILGTELSKSHNLPNGLIILNISGTCSLRTLKCHVIIIVLQATDVIWLTVINDSFNYRDPILIV